MAAMTAVSLYAPIAEGATLIVERDLDRLNIHIGQWAIELFNGKLTVRPKDAAINAGRDVLQVDA